MIPSFNQNQTENVLEFQCYSLGKYRFSADEDNLRTCCFHYCWEPWWYNILFIVFHFGHLCRSKETTKNYFINHGKSHSWKKMSNSKTRNKIVYSISACFFAAKSYYCYYNKERFLGKGVQYVFNDLSDDLVCCHKIINHAHLTHLVIYLQFLAAIFSSVSFTRFLLSLFGISKIK